MYVNILWKNLKVGQQRRNLMGQKYLTGKFNNLESWSIKKVGYESIETSPWIHLTSIH